MDALLRFIGPLARHIRPGIFTILGLTLLAGSVFVSIAGYYLLNKQISMWGLLEVFYANLGAELGGIAITILFVDRISRAVVAQQQKRSLILQMGSRNNDLAREAVRVLRIEGWLVQGALKGASLEGANLQEVNLESANMVKVDFDGANLSKTNLYRANLREASLVESRLTSADLPLADLSRAKLLNADLAGAILDGTILRGAILDGANLLKASLDKAVLNEDTRLPDGTTWHHGVDLGKFTNPSHPEFWRSRDPGSPAHRA